MCWGAGPAGGKEGNPLVLRSRALPTGARNAPSVQGREGPAPPASLPRSSTFKGGVLTVTPHLGVITSRRLHPGLTSALPPPCSVALGKCCYASEPLCHIWKVRLLVVPAGWAPVRARCIPAERAATGSRWGGGTARHPSLGPRPCLSRVSLAVDIS